MIEAVPMGPSDKDPKPQPEIEIQSSFERAGFRTGDVISYKIGSIVNIAELDLQSPSKKHPQGGALLLRAGSSGEKVYDDF